MSKTKVLAVLVILVSMPMVMFAGFTEHMDRLEFGVSTGIGFYVGQRSPVEGSGLMRVQAYDAIGFNGAEAINSWPGIETFGFMVGYRFDSRWHLNLQTVRQRVAFEEWNAGEKHSSSRTSLTTNNITQCGIWMPWQSLISCHWVIKHLLVRASII